MALTAPGSVSHPQQPEQTPTVVQGHGRHDTPNTLEHDMTKPTEAHHARRHLQREAATVYAYHRAAKDAGYTAWVACHEHLRANGWHGSETVPVADATRIAVIANLLCGMHGSFDFVAAAKVPRFTPATDSFLAAESVVAAPDGPIANFADGTSLQYDNQWTIYLSKRETSKAIAAQHRMVEAGTRV